MPDPHAPSPDSPEPAREQTAAGHRAGPTRPRLDISEDWAATLVGLVLLALALATVIKPGVIP